jgi:hypothetical protein
MTELLLDLTQVLRFLEQVHGRAMIIFQTDPLPYIGMADLHGLSHNQVLIFNSFDTLSLLYSVVLLKTGTKRHNMGNYETLNRKI